jgi:hypothetical protein
MSWPLGVVSPGHRDLRYNLVTEQEVLPRLSPGAEGSYDPLSG